MAGAPELVSVDRAHDVPTLCAVRLEGLQIGDIVEVDRLGRRFYALVTGNASGGLSIQPLDRRISYRSCRADDVVTHWAKRAASSDQRAA